MADPPSLAVCLGKILLSGRLPISVGVLGVMLKMEDENELICSVVKLGVGVEKISSVWFVVSIPFSAIEFCPTPTVRDAVLNIMKQTQQQSPVTSIVPVCEKVDASKCECAERIHFKGQIRDGITDKSLGFCSYLNLCTKPDCKFLHFGSPSSNEVKQIDLSESTWINCDIRTFPLSIFAGRVAAILLDPPWDIHMELNYGTLSDDELRALPIQNIHLTSGGFIFIWATSRTVEVARDCLRIWGYTRVDEIIWVKVNQIMGTVRSGRTGHWLNHNKEHCLVGVKGNVPCANVGKYRQDCDVIVSAVGENSRKPEEIYSIIERLVGDSDLPCLELFGRPHNRRPNGWITLGNQLGDSQVKKFPLHT